MPALAAAQLACNETKSCSTSTSLKVEHHLVDGAYVLCNFSSGLPLNYFYWAFSYSHLITILRTGSELELSPLYAACCQACLLHRRTLNSSFYLPQQNPHSADVQILNSLR